MKFKILTFLLLVSASYSVLGENNINTCTPTSLTGKTYFVAPNGHDYKGKGTREHPWKNIDFALYKAQETDTIIVKPGVYSGEVRLKKRFNAPVLVKAQIPYQSKLTNNGRVLAIVGQAQNIIVEGFEITHSSKDATPLVVHIDAYGGDQLKNITLKNNIIHDSYNNDLLKINNGVTDINIHCNLFYNQGDFDEHIDVNSAKNIDISDNVFFNDFTASDRTITKKSSSYIVVKDSNANSDKILGSSNISIQRNIFFNWQGSVGHGFLLIGEDGKPYYEANDVRIYNNLFLGNSSHDMRSPIGIKGANDVQIVSNTTQGDLPSNAYAIRINREGENLINKNIRLYHNIWSDPTGTMGAGAHQTDNDFSDVLPNQLDDFILASNIIFNGNKALPHSYFDKINPDDDETLIEINPNLTSLNDSKRPVWLPETLSFADDSLTIKQLHYRLAVLFGTPQSSAINLPIESVLIPTHDLIGNERTSQRSIGAVDFPDKD